MNEKRIRVIGSYSNTKGWEIFFKKPLRSDSMIFLNSGIDYCPVKTREIIKVFFEDPTLRKIVGITAHSCKKCPARPNNEKGVGGCKIYHVKEPEFSGRILFEYLVKNVAASFKKG